MLASSFGYRKKGQTWCARENLWKMRHQAESCVWVSTCADVPMVGAIILWLTRLCSAEPTTGFDPGRLCVIANSCQSIHPP
ncbi:ATPase component CbiO [Anopheles sinensis]|uniref:ATPase component CbiO n=1 Tax=Anopheles sinensis TaxID=74873 RepID=A0A084VGC6_ANOSI|nr:ATPase component CbiO [Anopheles sinensis]